MTRVQTLSAAQARRIALAAQGFADRPHDPPTMRTLVRTVARTGVLQIDSVNVLCRAHYMPLFSRMGPYDRDLLHRAAGRAPRRLVEYWAHVAAFMPVDLWPVMAHRRRRYADQGHEWSGMRHRPSLAGDLVAEVRRTGPVTARDLDDGRPRSRQHWGWNWSETKKALEYLFFAGELAVAGRNGAFERLYDVPERVLPAAVLARPEPSDAEAHRTLLSLAARSLGVAGAYSLRDYYRMRPEEAAPALAALVEAGELVPVRVEGWSRPAYLHAQARLPRRVPGAALLSPFDPVVWERSRTEELFGFRYRIEIYVPEAKRVHGYYVLPFLLDEALVARVDLKADRAAGVLSVLGAFSEPGAPVETADRLGAELRRLAGWLGLGEIRVADHGDLAPRLGGRWVE